MTTLREWLFDAPGAIAFVQEVAAAGTAGATTSLVLTLSGVATKIGNHLILCVSTNSILVLGSFTISDSQGNTWQKDAVQASTSSTALVVSCKITTALLSGDTITISWSPTSTTGAASVAEYSGLAQSAWLDKTATSSGAAATASDSGATATTQLANELLIGALAPAGSITGYTPEVLSPVWNVNTQATPSSGNLRPIQPMYRVVAAAAAYNAKATWTTGRPWAQIIATYKMADASEGFNAVAIGGGGVLDSDPVFQGIGSYDLDCTGAAKGHVWSAGFTTGRIYCGTFRLWWDADTAGSASIIQIDNTTTGAAQLQLRPGRKLRGIFGGGVAGADSAAMNLGQWYLIDFLIRTDGATGTIDFSIDSVAQGQATIALGPADCSGFRLENTGTNAYHVHVDAIKLTDQATDYPLGRLRVPSFIRYPQLLAH